MQHLIIKNAPALINLEIDTQELISLTLLNCRKLPRAMVERLIIQSPRLLQTRQFKIDFEFSPRKLAWYCHQYWLADRLRAGYSAGLEDKSLLATNDTSQWTQTNIKALAKDGVLDLSGIPLIDEELAFILRNSPPGIQHLRLERCSNLSWSSIESLLFRSNLETITKTNFQCMPSLDGKNITTEAVIAMDTVCDDFYFLTSNNVLHICDAETPLNVKKVELWAISDGC